MWVIPVKPAHSPGPSAPAICSTIPLKTAMLSAVTQCLGEIHLLQVVQQKLQKKKKISSVRFFVHHAIQGEKVPPLWGRAPRGAGMLCWLDAAVGWRWHRSSPQRGQTSQFLEAAQKVLVWNIWQTMRRVTLASLALGWPWTIEHGSSSSAAHDGHAFHQRSSAQPDTTSPIPLCCGPVKPQKLSFHKYHVLFLLGWKLRGNDAVSHGYNTLLRKVASRATWME